MKNHKNHPTQSKVHKLLDMFDEDIDDKDEDKFFVHSSSTETSDPSDLED